LKITEASWSKEQMHQEGSEPTDILELRKAIHDLHGLDTEHVESVHVSETFEDKTWRGTVEVFRACGQPYDEHVYAWSHSTPHGQKYHVAVLGVLPIKTPNDAVRLAVERGIDHFALPSISYR
jgi:hypothetical protein